MASGFGWIEDENNRGEYSLDQLLTKWLLASLDGSVAEFCTKSGQYLHVKSLTRMQ